MTSSKEASSSAFWDHKPGAINLHHLKKKISKFVHLDTGSSRKRFTKSIEKVTTKKNNNNLTVQ